MDWYDYARIFATPVAAAVLAGCAYIVGHVQGYRRGRADRDEYERMLVELYTWPKRPATVEHVAPGPPMRRYIETREAMKRIDR